MIAAICLIIAALCICFLLHKINYRKTGGAYQTYVSEDKKSKTLTIPPSWHISNSFNRTKDQGDVVRWIVNSSDEIQRNFLVTINGSNYRYPKLTAEYVSDANIDFIAFVNEFYIIRGFAVCEYESMYNYSECSIIKADLKNHLASVWKNDAIVSSIEDDGFIELSKRKHDTNIYVEFVYEEIDNVPKAYINIHLSTLDCIALVKTYRNTKKRNVFVFRIRVNNNGTIDRKPFNIYSIENEEFKVVTFLKGNLPKPTRVIIPQTKSSLRMDEYIDFNTEAFSYMIQVEHSESLNSHKCNLLEFLMRVIGYNNEDKSRNIEDEHIYRINDPIMLEEIESNNISPNTRRSMETFKCKELREINSFILIISTMRKIGYNFRDKFICSNKISRDSPFYISWPEFAERYLDVE